MATAEVEVVLVALAEPEGNMSSARILEPHAESWTPRLRVVRMESSKYVMKKL
jgi:hypothetical protein